jgi:LCP family protein required for cell wall assembly
LVDVDEALETAVAMDEAATSADDVETDAAIVAPGAETSAEVAADDAATDDDDEPEAAAIALAAPAVAAATDDAADADDETAAAEDAATPPVAAEDAGRTAELDDEPTDDVAALTVAAEDAPTEGDFQDYVNQIEAAAARQRAEQLGETGAGGAAVRPRRDARAASAAQPRPRTAADGRRRPAGAQRRKRKDTRPWYKRPRTWFIALAMLPVLAGIIITLYLANILRLSYNAYNDIHEDPVTDRVRYRVNPEGTPEAIPTDQTELVLPDWDQNDPINILLLGIDSRPEDDEESPPRSDTTLIVHIDPATKQAAMMSVPRDLEVTIPEFGLNKMNAAYPLGEANAETIEGGGPTLVAQTIEANFNIPVHYYATVNFDGFIEIIDTVGGVVVDVEAPLSDNLYPTEDLGVTRVHFQTGLQKMDGELALRYVRTRHGDNDIRRGDRQAQVLTALQAQALDLNLITRAEELLNGLADTFRTDLDHTQMLALANLARQIDMAAVQKVNLWDAGVLSEYEAEDGAFYFIADWEAVAGLLAEPFGLAATAEEAPPAETPDNPNGAGGGTPTEPRLDVQVLVENGTDIPLLAGNAAQMLFDAGFSAVWPSDAPDVSDATVIYDATGDAVTARYVAEVLGLPATAIVETSDGDGITVVLGGDVPATLVPTPEPTPEE